MPVNEAITKIDYHTLSFSHDLFNNTKKFKELVKKYDSAKHGGNENNQLDGDEIQKFEQAIKYMDKSGFNFENLLIVAALENGSPENFAQTQKECQNKKLYEELTKTIENYEYIVQSHEQNRTNYLNTCMKYFLKIDKYYKMEQKDGNIIVEFLQNREKENIVKELGNQCQNLKNNIYKAGQKIIIKNAENYDFPKEEEKEKGILQKLIDKLIDKLI